MTTIQADQINALRETAYDAGEKTTLYRKGRNYLLATEHAHGLWRTIIQPDGSIHWLASGPVPNGWKPLESPAEAAIARAEGD